MNQPRPAETVSELNNLIQIISSTSSFIENIWDGTAGSEKYFSMLRASIARAEQMTSGLAAQAGSTGQKLLFHPDIGVHREAAGRPTASTRPQSILVVDDEAMTGSLLQALLADEEYSATSAQSGFECLDLVQRDPGAFDLVLLDFSMPGMDGSETFRRLRKIAPQVKVILITGFVSQESLDQLLREGLSGFLGKPFTHFQILALVAAVLANSGGHGTPSAV